DPDASCEAPGFGDSNVVVGLGTLETLLEDPFLQPGTWILRAEVFSPAPQSWELATTSAPFTVLPGRETVAGCDPSIGNAAADAFKRASAHTTRMATNTCTAFAVKEGVDEVTGAFTNLTASFALLASPSLSGAVGLGAGVLGFEIPSSENLAKELLNKIACNVAKMHEDIALDPPDPNFGTVIEVQRQDVPAVGTPA